MPPKKIKTAPKSAPKAAELPSVRNADMPARSPRRKVTAPIEAAAKATGINPKTLVTIASAESKAGAPARRRNVTKPLPATPKDVYPKHYETKNVGEAPPRFKAFSERAPFRNVYHAVVAAASDDSIIATFKSRVSERTVVDGQVRLKFSLTTSLRVDNGGWAVLAAGEDVQLLNRNGEVKNLVFTSGQDTDSVFVQLRDKDRIYQLEVEASGKIDHVEIFEKIPMPSISITRLPESQMDQIRKLAKG